MFDAIKLNRNLFGDHAVNWDGVDYVSKSFLLSLLLSLLLLSLLLSEKKKRKDKVFPSTLDKNLFVFNSIRENA